MRAFELSILWTRLRQSRRDMNCIVSSAHVHTVEAPMIRSHFRSTLAIVAMLVIATPSCARASATKAASPNAHGSMTIGGKTSELQHAYLVRQPPESVPQYGYLKVLITN